VPESGSFRITTCQRLKPLSESSSALKGTKSNQLLGSPFRDSRSMHTATGGWSEDFRFPTRVPDSGNSQKTTRHERFICAKSGRRRGKTEFQCLETYSRSQINAACVLTRDKYLCRNNRVFINPVWFEKTPVSPRIKYLKISASVLNNRKRLAEVVWKLPRSGTRPKKANSESMTKVEPWRPKTWPQKGDYKLTTNHLSFGG
jgi:hypothetical protein